MFLFSFYPVRDMAGFTLVEIMVVLAVVGTLLAFSSVNLVGYQRSNLLRTSVSTIVGDIQDQRLRSMNGDTQGRATLDSYGVYIQTNSYVLFHGNSYSAGTSGNVTIPVQSPLQISTTFPSTQLVFTKGSGEIAGFNGAQNTITIRNTSNNENIVLTFNQYGTIISGMP